MRLAHCNPGFSADCVNCPGHIFATEVVSGPGGSDKASTIAMVERWCDCDCHITVINLNRPPIHVNHTELKRLYDESIFKSICPACTRGTLVMRRDPDTFELLAEDRCLLCAQLVIYDDIETMKAHERGEECQSTESS